MFRGWFQQSKWRPCLRRAAFCCAFWGGQEDAVQRIFTKNCFLFTVGSVCRVKWFGLSGKHFADEEKIEETLRKCLRQQSIDFYAVSFDALVK
jgi:hypothetical protein